MSPGASENSSVKFETWPGISDQDPFPFRTPRFLLENRNRSSFNPNHQNHGSFSFGGFVPMVIFLFSLGDQEVTMSSQLRGEQLSSIRQVFTEWPRCKATTIVLPGRPVSVLPPCALTDYFHHSNTAGAKGRIYESPPDLWDLTRLPDPQLTHTLPTEQTHCHLNILLPPGPCSAFSQMALA